MEIWIKEKPTLKSKIAQGAIRDGLWRVMKNPAIIDMYNYVFLELETDEVRKVTDDMELCVRNVVNKINDQINQECEVLKPD